jgi:hypothetical protein
VRQTVPDVLNVHVELQHEVAVPLLPPWSHCSPDSTTPFPQAARAAVGARRSTVERARVASGRTYLGFI